ncbi:MAG TPA: DEAD/DEAH box helicase family protein [Ruminiclostridium sp.]|nr:DEAD/DEAH box helicase family protein [Ruminiclostridium sp.]
MDKLKSQLKGNGWSEEELMYDEILSSQGGDREFKASVLLINNSYLFGIVKIVPQDLYVNDFVKTLWSEVSTLNLKNIFVYFGGDFFRVTNEGDVDLRTPAHMGLGQLMSQMSQTIGVPTNMDPRFAKPGIRLATHLRVPQLLAISRTLDAIVNGQSAALVVMPVGLGKTYVQIVVVSKLLASNYVSSALCIVPNIAIGKIAANTYRQAGIATFEVGKNLSLQPGLGIVTVQRLSLGNNQDESLSLRSLPVELVVIDEPIVLETRERLGLLERFDRKILLGFGAVEATTGPFFGKTSFKYVSSNVTGDLIVPSGFKAYELGTLAEITQGLRISAESENVGKGTYVISARDIDEDGNVLYQHKGRIADSQLEKFRISKGDVLISGAGVNRKVAYIRDCQGQEAIFAGTLIRIRAIEPLISQHLYEFLSSSLGNAILDRISYGTVQKHLTVTALMSAFVYLPQDISVIENRKSDAVETGGAHVEFRKESSVIETLKLEVIPKLEALLKKPEKALSERAIDVTEVASILKRLSVDLGGRSLEEHVLDSFPFPIALAYRRFRDAKFNVFERVLRLRDLAESCSFFIYNACLMDYFHNLKASGYVIQDKGARKAFSGFSMAARIDFVSELLQQRKTGKVHELFLSELCKYDDFSAVSRTLNEDLRNSISHTAAASESQQERILHDFTPIIYEMLEKLKFLTQYRLVRIPSYYVRDHKIFRRLEVYSGVSHYLDEEEIDAGQVTAKIGGDHLVLLNSEGQQLNLFPLYQLISNLETRHESHLCIFKQRRNNVLQGESLPGSFEIELIGEEYFSKFLAQSEI